MRRRPVTRLLGGVLLVAGGFLTLAWPTSGAEAAILSDGPLTRIHVGDELACQVAYRGDASFEFYPPASTLGSCGTFLAVDGVVYAPEFFGATSWSPVSQAPPAGAGTAADPFRIVTVVAAAETGLRVEQIDSYVVGSQAYRTEIRLVNDGGGPIAGTLYRAGDCYLQESDTGLGRVDGGAPACVATQAADARIELWLPITPGSHFMEGHYSDVFAVIGEGRQLPDTCTCDEHVDNGAGLSWSVSLPPGGSATYVHETFFSPVGRAPVAQSFRDSVPGPTEITLDPVIVIQSVIISAGVILLVPFPSALFNSTLEENYDEVMAGLARLRGWLAAALGGAVAWLRSRVAQRGGTRAPPASAASGSAAVESAPPTARADPWRTPLGMLAFVFASALLYAFLDPTFGLSLVSLATLGGLFIGLLVTLLAYGVPLVLLARARRLPLAVRALPATLLIGVGCVVVSRAADFQPGYLYGLIIGFLFAGGVDRRLEGRVEATAVAISLGVSFVAWLGLAVLRANPTGELVSALVEAATVTAVVAGLENAIFAMLPLRFLPGAAVYAWDRRAWVVLLGLGLLGFTHVLLNPTAGYLADASRTSLLTMVLLLIGFGAGSAAFWAYFRFRPRRTMRT